MTAGDFASYQSLNGWGFKILEKVNSSNGTTVGGLKGYNLSIGSFNVHLFFWAVRVERRSNLENTKWHTGPSKPLEFKAKCFTIGAQNPNLLSQNTKYNKIHELSLHSGLVKIVKASRDISNNSFSLMPAFSPYWRPSADIAFPK